MYRDIPTQLLQLVEPIVCDYGLELVDVESVQTPGNGLLRVTVDRAEGDGRVPVDTCAELSREIESHLDAEDPMPGRYRLEVSSPGLNRVLAREKDFAAACGSEVKIQTRRPLSGRRRFRGVLRDFRDGVARVEVEGEESLIPFDAVSKANTVYQFSRADFQAQAAK